MGMGEEGIRAGDVSWDHRQQEGLAIIVSYSSVNLGGEKD